MRDLPDDFVFCDVRWRTDVPGEHICSEHRPGHQEHVCCCGALYSPGRTTPEESRADMNADIAEMVERIAQAVEHNACDGSDDSCEDVKKGAPCPYDDAARIVREFRNPPVRPTTNPQQPELRERQEDA